MVSFYPFPVIFIDTVTIKKGTLIKRAGVRTPWTPLDPPLKCRMDLFVLTGSADFTIGRRQSRTLRC